MDLSKYPKTEKFLRETNMSLDDAFIFIERELEKRSVGNGKYMEEKPRI